MFQLVNIIFCDMWYFCIFLIHILCLRAISNLLNSNLLISQISSLNVKLQRLTVTWYNKVLQHFLQVWSLCDCDKQKQNKIKRKEIIIAIKIIFLYSCNYTQMYESPINRIGYLQTSALNRTSIFFQSTNSYLSQKFCILHLNILFMVNSVASMLTKYLWHCKLWYHEVKRDINYKNVNILWRY